MQVTSVIYGTLVYLFLVSINVALQDLTHMHVTETWIGLIMIDIENQGTCNGYPDGPVTAWVCNVMQRKSHDTLLINNLQCGP